MQTTMPTTFDLNFLKGSTWGQPNEPVQHLETHAAHVFLCGNRAYKVKKPVTLPYLDFSSREKRRAVLRREFEINGPWAPSLYLGVSEIDHEPVLVMRRFDQSTILKEFAAKGPLQAAIITALAETIASAHASAKPVNIDGVRIMEKLFDQLRKAFRDSPEIFPGESTSDFEARYKEHLMRCSEILRKRGTKNLVRRCHGDMHCSNIIVENGNPILFDAIEFSEELGTIDVLYDLAFLLMDLMQFDQRNAACQLLNDYLDLRRVEEDLSGLIALPMFLATRAGVRALVAADLAHELSGSSRTAKEHEARSYLTASISFLQNAKPKLICIGGLSSTGKSSLALKLAPAFDPTPGAIVIRSDVERKRLLGVALTERLPAIAYTPETSRQVYGAMFVRAETALNAGHSVILDAVFLTETERNAARNLLVNLDISFHGLWLEADESVARQRISNRKDDASDATVDVLERQRHKATGPVSWLHIDASGSAERTLGLAMRSIAYPSSIWRSLAEVITRATGSRHETNF
jgi:uncharacterized protein